MLTTTSFRLKVVHNATKYQNYKIIKNLATYVHMGQKKKSVIWSSIFMTLRLKLLYHIIRLLYTGKSLSEALNLAAINP